MTLKPHSAAKAFNDMLILLGKMRGISGVPLASIVRFNLKSPYNTLYGDPTTDPPVFGRPGSPYSSVDEELIARAAILRNDLTQGQLSASHETLEDSLLDTKPPETPALTLEPHSAAKAFNDMLILLGKMRGIAGHPLSYVPRPSLKGPNDADPDDETKDPSPIGQPGSPYVSNDNKLCSRALILRTDLTHLQLSASLETLETDRPFEPSFLTNMAMVYNILHSCWGKLSWWHHVKKFSKTKNR